jgi:hypothetical protein
VSQSFRISALRNALNSLKSLSSHPTTSDNWILCSSLVSFTIPSSASDLGPHIFDNCSRLASVVFPPPSQIKHIPDGLFCRELPASVESICGSAFECILSVTGPDCTISHFFGIKYQGEWGKCSRREPRASGRGRSSSATGWRESRWHRLLRLCDVPHAQ